MQEIKESEMHAVGTAVSDSYIRPPDVGDPFIEVWPRWCKALTAVSRYSPVASRR